LEAISGTNLAWLGVRVKEVGTHTLSVCNISAWAKAELILQLDAKYNTGG